MSLISLDLSMQAKVTLVVGSRLLLAPSEYELDIWKDVMDEEIKYLVTQNQKPCRVTKILPPYMEDGAMRYTLVVCFEDGREATLALRTFTYVGPPD